jgi:hypothetical protein
MKKTLIATSILLSLTSCATVVSGTTQNISVITKPVDGANCELTDSKGGKWFLNNTPSNAMVKKGDGPMNIVCKKDAYKTGTTTVDDELVGSTFGNILIGGGIGAGIDAYTGAAQKYPDSATVWLEPNNFANEAARKKYFDEKTAFEAEEDAKKNKNSTKKDKRK